MQQFGYKSVMEVPRITKITLNMGVGEAVGDKKILEHAIGDMAKIAGQKPVDDQGEEVDRGFQDPRRLSDRLHGHAAWCRACTSSSIAS
jgi:large subunit ribosomal protein L5